MKHQHDYYHCLQVTDAFQRGVLLWQLQEAHLSGHVPGLPHGMVVGGGQAGVGEGGAGRGPHDALCQQEVAEQAGHQKILQRAHHLLTCLVVPLLCVQPGNMPRASCQTFCV